VRKKKKGRVISADSLAHKLNFSPFCHSRVCSVTKASSKGHFHTEKEQQGVHLKGGVKAIRELHKKEERQVHRGIFNSLILFQSLLTEEGKRERTDFSGWGGRPLDERKRAKKNNRRFANYTTDRQPR